MTDHDKTNDGPEKDQHKPGDKPSGMVARLRQLYEERPAVFAVLLMGFSALVFLLGVVLSGSVA